MTPNEPQWIGALPPTARRNIRDGYRDWQKLLEPLRERPGEWAYVADFGDKRHAAYQATRNIRIGLTQGTTAGEFDARSIQENGKWRVAAVYLNGDAP
jgi:hypothetical protein